MRRRVLQATLAALSVAMVLLGIPLAVFAFQLVRDDALRDLESRTSMVSRAVEVRYVTGEKLDESIVENFLGQSQGAPKHIAIKLPDGEQIEAGEEPQRSFRSSHVSDSGIVTIVSISQEEVFVGAAQAVALVIVVGVVAVIAAVMVALWQANRLAAPLIYLSAFAEQIGSGHTRPVVKLSGVEEIDLVSEELARSAERTAARLAAERQFAADASHQLRTPLTALSMRLEEIAATTTQEEVRVEAEASLEQIERLVGVVDDLLGRTRRARGSGTALLDLSEVLEQQAAEWSGPFGAQSRELIVGSTAAKVFASPGGLSQVLATLIENSLVHGGGTTTVSVRDSGGSRAVIIEVRDEGEGVADELAPHIFEREVTSGKGTGRGLALARDLAAADGGRLELVQRRPAVFQVFLQQAPTLVDVSDVVPHSRAVRTRNKPRKRRQG